MDVGVSQNSYSWERWGARVNWLTIDPGISGTGIALFKNKELIWWDNFYPKGATWKEKAIHADAVLSVLFIRLKPFKVFIEWPTGQFSSKAGLAAQNTDGMLKLSYLIGRLSSWIDTVLIPVIKWKGNLAKTVVASRVETWLNKKQPGLDIRNLKSHAIDAVGLGKYIIEETTWVK